MIFITKPWHLNIKDEKIVGNKKFCPPHWFPHLLPFITKPVKDERCHFHKKKWRMEHHTFYCRLLKCPHYKSMILKYKKEEKKK